MSFGKQLRLRREELGLSRAALAEELGVSASAISNYENDLNSPHTYNLYSVLVLVL